MEKKMKEKITVAVVGSRTFNDWDFFFTKMQELFIVADIKCIVSGGARGADKMAERFAEVFEIPTQIFKPRWDTYGKAAGFIRNEDIIDAADAVVAFWNGKSTGTKHSIGLAEKSNKTLYVVNV